MTTTISNANLAAVINHKGAELISLKTINPEKDFIWDGNPEHWAKHSPILFPIVGTLKHNSYTYNNVTFQLPRHGFARDMEFDLIEKTNQKAVFSLKSDKETKTVYPFDFELQLVYQIDEAELTITYRVINKGQETMYYAIGGHPAFALPNKFTNYSLQFESGESLLRYPLENDLLSDKIVDIPLKEDNLPLTYSLFENDALIFKTLKSKKIQLFENEAPMLSFKFNDFKNFGIWTKPNAPFICLEPWAGYSDVSNATGNMAEKEAIQKLDANALKEYSFSIQIL